MALLLVPAGARAQTAPRANEDPLRSLYGLAELQLRAARLAAERDTRPEVKRLAAAMAAWRAEQVPRLRAFLEARGIRDAGMLEDQETVWEGMERLDFLGLTRRYAETQLRALDLEIEGYGRATAAAGDPAVGALAAELLPELRRFREAAAEAHRAVTPQ